MRKTTGAFGLAFLVMALIVMIGVGFLMGPTSPFPWILVAVLIALPYLHKRLVGERFLQWKEAYSVGIEAIDDDHKRLLHLINNLETAAHYHTGETFERQALSDLIDYTRTHFAREETLMSDNGYPEFESHKHQHEAMIAKVNEFVARYEKDRDGTIEEMLDFLRKWLINHIAGTDQEYSGFLTDKGVK